MDIQSNLTGLYFAVSVNSFILLLYVIGTVKADRTLRKIQRHIRKEDFEKEDFQKEKPEDGMVKASVKCPACGELFKTWQPVEIYTCAECAVSTHR